VQEAARAIQTPREETLGSQIDVREEEEEEGEEA